MAKVVTVGGSISGLALALILSRRGHDVTVVERDPDPTPADSDDAWCRWRRRGVPHLRGTHMFAARIAVLRHHLPDVLAGLKEAGGREVPAGEPLPPSLQVTRLNCRRTTYELVLRRAALRQCGVRFLAGSEVTGLIPAPRTIAGAPHVVGVYTARGDVLCRRPRRRRVRPRISPRVLAARHRSRGTGHRLRLKPHVGAHPLVSAPPTRHRGHTGDARSRVRGRRARARRQRRVLFHLRCPRPRPGATRAAARRTVPAGGDVPPARRPLGRSRRGHPDQRRAVPGRPPQPAQPARGGRDAADQRRRLHQPSLWAGASLALVHAAALADVLDEHDAPVTVATAFAGATQRELEPWYHDAVSDDEVRRLIAERIRDGEPLSSIGTGGDGPAVRFARATPFAVQRDPGGARRLSPDPEPPRPTVGVHREPRDPGSGRGVWRAIEHDPPSPPGPSYPEFVRTLGAAEAAAGRRQPPV